MKSIRKNWGWWLALVLALGFWARYQLAPVPVTAHVVEKGEIAGEVMGTGTLEARVKTTISPRIQERLAEVLADQGDAVVAGQLLARLDDGELKRQVEVAEAMLASAQATADRVRVDEARAQAVAQQAELDHKRISGLLATGVSPQAEMDKAVERLQVAGSDLLRARAATKEAEQQIISARKSLAYQEERLGFTRLVSPYDGLITRRDRDPGGVVMPGASILRLISTNELWVAAWVDETAAAGLAEGQNARVIFRSEASQVYPGKIARLGRETDRETREFLVDVKVERLPRNWTIGQRAEVYLETGRLLDALTAPSSCLIWREGKPGVFVMEGRKAVWREVTAGAGGRGRVEIVQGLKAGERVVAPRDAGQAPLRSGQRVAVKGD